MNHISWTLRKRVVDLYRWIRHESREIGRELLPYLRHFICSLAIILLIAYGTSVAARYLTPEELKPIKQVETTIEVAYLAMLGTATLYRLGRALVPRRTTLQAGMLPEGLEYPYFKTSDVIVPSNLWHKLKHSPAPAVRFVYTSLSTETRMRLETDAVANKDWVPMLVSDLNKLIVSKDLGKEEVFEIASGKAPPVNKTLSIDDLLLSNRRLLATVFPIELASVETTPKVLAVVAGNGGSRVEGERNEDAKTSDAPADATVMGNDVPPDQSTQPLPYRVASSSVVAESQVLTVRQEG